MRIQVKTSIPPELSEPTWQLYTTAFDELRVTAVQRHVMYRVEFDQVLSDTRVLKYLGRDDRSPDLLTALATFTNELESMPLISPDYFAHRWPDLYAQRRIWYIGFFAVHPQYRGSGIFESVIADMWQRVQDSDGVAALDICRRNDQIGLGRAIHQTLGTLTEGARATRLDEQTFWLYELPPRP
ncbi:GNAT family N-acetyltransferase [Micromonospora sp. LOL_027]|uniref:GNAT family N-acetyltransferase n=1 Tax=Micromonospora sp. LOL_027 TaxID=3345419 RepID=UPI003A8897F7